MYTRSYKQKLKIQVYGYEEDVLLPDKPPIEEFRNFGLPEKDQKFYRDEVPAGIEDDRRKLDEVAAQRWHWRLHGDWWLIKGREVYIPGSAWFFLNTWICEYGGLADFRMEAVEYFQVAEHSLRAKHSYGLQIVKARRLGDTEKTLCFGYDITTRFRDSKFGMQNNIDVEAKKNFDRLVVAHSAMEPWFKPQHLGSDKPENALVFQYRPRAAGERAVDSAIALKKTGPRHLGSEIDFATTVYRRYDGRRLRFYHLDEYGKIPGNVMPVDRQWNVIRECLSLNGGRKIVGFAMLTTTVEDMKNGETVEMVRGLWEGSNPAIRQTNGRTTTGLVRYLRDYRLTADVDEWGFHLVAEAEKHRASQIAAYVEQKDMRALSDYKRKFPDGIEEALAKPSTECIMYPALLDVQMEKVKAVEAGRDIEGGIQPCARYSLFWTGAPFASDVRAVPDPRGRFEISAMPVVPNYRTFHSTPNGAPGNAAFDFAGIDPFDHTSGVSDGGFSIFRGFVPTMEPDIEYAPNDEGQPTIFNKGDMQTHRFVLTYKHRPPTPDEFYSDVAKALWFYGCRALPEYDKPGVIHYLERNGMAAYLAFKPKNLQLGAVSKTTPGIKANVSSIATWQEMLQVHVYEYSETYSHPNLLTDLRNFTGENRTKCDLVVAAGHAIMLAKSAESRIIKQKRSNARHNQLPV